jgi:hypothetical protein
MSGQTKTIKDLTTEVFTSTGEKKKQDQIKDFKIA